MMERTIRLLSAFLIAILMPFGVASAATHSDMPRAAIGAAATLATVQSIDHETRLVTLRYPDGKSSTFVAGEEVRNLDQVEKGDLVLMEYFAGLAVALEPKGMGIRERREEMTVTRAKPGEKPAGTVTKTVDIVATVEAVDPDARTVTLKGVNRTLTFKAADDIDLYKVRLGDEVVARYVELFAVAVQPAPKVSGEVQLEAKVAAVGVGYGWGSGTLTMYDGSVHKFKVSGLSIVDVGFSKIQASGKVYKLTDPADFAGTYAAGSVGATLVGGTYVTTTKNSKGVVMHLNSTQEGARVTLAAGGIKIQMEK